VPGRIGPTPGQLFPVTTSWRHTRVWAWGIDHQLTCSIDDPFGANFGENAAPLPQNSFWSAFSRYRAPYMEPQGNQDEIPRDSAA
jgi:hypothetical protein